MIKLIKAAIDDRLTNKQFVTFLISLYALSGIVLAIAEYINN